VIAAVQTVEENREQLRGDGTLPFLGTQDSNSLKLKVQIESETIQKNAGTASRGPGNRKKGQANGNGPAQTLCGGNGPRIVEIQR